MLLQPDALRQPPEAGPLVPLGGVARRVREAGRGQFGGDDPGELGAAPRDAQADHHEHAEPEPRLPRLGAPGEFAGDRPQQVLVAGGAIRRGRVRRSLGPLTQRHGEDGEEREHGEGASAPAGQERGERAVPRRPGVAAAQQGRDGEHQAGPDEREEQTTADRGADDPQPDDRARPQHLQPPRAQRVREDAGRVEAQRGRDDPLFVEVELLDHPVAVAGVQVGPRAQQPGGLAGVRGHGRRTVGRPARVLWLLGYEGSAHADPPVRERTSPPRGVTGHQHRGRAGGCEPD